MAGISSNFPFLSLTQKGKGVEIFWTPNTENSLMPKEENIGSTKLRSKSSGTRNSI